MKQQTFEQRRIVQLSKELDAQRDKYAKLAKDSGFLNARLKETQQQMEESKQKLIEFQIKNHRIVDQLRQLERQNQKYRDQFEQQQKRRSQAEVENVRQRQKIDQLKDQLEAYENKTKGMLFERSAQISLKDKQIYRLKEENIEVEKIYLSEKERLQKRQQKHLRDLTRLFQEFQAIKKQLNALRISSQRQIEAEKSRHKREMTEVVSRVEQLQSRIRRQQEMQQQIDYMKGRMEDVIMQNSQKIIELYKYKYAK